MDTVPIDRGPIWALPAKEIQPLLFACDILVVSCAGIAAAAVFQLALKQQPFNVEIYGGPGLLLGILAAVIAAMDGQYELDQLCSRRSAATRAVRSFNVAFALYVCGLFFTQLTDVYSRGTLLLQYATICGIVLVSRVGLVTIMQHAAVAGYVRPRRLGLVGVGDGLARFKAQLPASRRELQIAAVFDLPDWIVEPLDEPGCARLESITAELVVSLRRLALDDVVIVMPWRAASANTVLTQGLAVLPVRLQLAAEDAFFGSRAVRSTQIGDNVVVGVRVPTQGPLYQVAKRAFDVAFAASLLVFLAPTMIIIALAIKLDSPGPILFRQKRYGYNQIPFSIRKFRTMRMLDDDGRIDQARENDPRITRLGRALRRSSLDELPQLLDVLQGSMSLVGPRPHAVAHDVHYGGRIPLYARRQIVKPGITGWAQVHGLRGETDTDDKMQRRIEYDLQYIDNASFLLDLRILLWTICSSRTFENAR
jgi:Undecaprenyl-phosphate glucose phosphotransferase